MLYISICHRQQASERNWSVSNSGQRQIPLGVSGNLHRGRTMHTTLTHCRHRLKRDVELPRFAGFSRSQEWSPRVTQLTEPFPFRGVPPPIYSAVFRRSRAEDQTTSKASVPVVGQLDISQLAGTGWSNHFPCPLSMKL